MKFTTILLDGDIYLHRACSIAAQVTNWDDQHETRLVNVEQAQAWIKNELAKLRKRLGAQKVVVALGDRSGNFRKELCSTYKAHRTGGKPPGFATLERMFVKGCKVIREDRLEGDDILGLALTREPEGKVCVSVDKDLLQIPGYHYNPDADAVRHVDEEEADLRHLTQTLTGDRVDGYPGCPGIGPVGAGRILAGDRIGAWERVVAAFEKAKLTEEHAVLQARLAFVLRQGWYDRKAKEVKLWTP